MSEETNVVDFFKLIFRIKEYEPYNYENTSKDIIPFIKIQRWYKKIKLRELFELYFINNFLFKSQNVVLSDYYLTEENTFDFIGFMEDYTEMIKNIDHTEIT